MTQIKRFEYSDNNKVRILRTETANKFLWEAFNLTDDVCIIQKVGGFAPNQIFYVLEREVSAIVAMKISGNYLYVAYDDDELMGEKISLTNPLTDTTQFSIPSGIAESPVDIVIDSTRVYFLLPGNLTGINAQIVKFNTSGVFQSIIDLSKTGEDIVNARSMTFDSSELWIVTYTDPTKVVRVFNLLTTPDFESTEIV